MKGKQNKGDLIFMYMLQTSIGGWEKLRAKLFYCLFWWQKKTKNIYSRHRVLIRNWNFAKPQIIHISNLSVLKCFQGDFVSSVQISSENSKPFAIQTLSAFLLSFFGDKKKNLVLISSLVLHFNALIIGFFWFSQLRLRSFRGKETT